MTIKRGQNMANLSIHKIFMENVQTIKNILMSNGEFHLDNEVYGKNIETNFHTMSNYRGISSRYINGMYSMEDNYKKYERITNVLSDTEKNEKLYRDKLLKADLISTKILQLKKLISSGIKHENHTKRTWLSNGTNI